jgi:hypothetical protein
LGARLDTCFEFLIHPLIHALSVVYKACNNAYKTFDVFSTSMSPARARPTLATYRERIGGGGGGGEIFCCHTKKKEKTGAQTNFSHF